MPKVRWSGSRVEMVSAGPGAEVGKIGWNSKSTYSEEDETCKCLNGKYFSLNKT